MRTEDLLAAIATGLWRWDSVSGAVSYDAEAARLVGLPAEAVTLPEAAARACFHPADWLEIKAIVELAVAEGTLAEARLRIVDEKGTVLRTVRTRSRPIPRGGPEDGYYLLGILQEVPEALPGTSAVGPQITGDWRRNREAFLLDAGRALAEAMSTAEVLRVAAGLSMPGFSPDGLAVFGVQGDRISVIGHHGPREAADHPFQDMALETDCPAAEVVRTGRAVYLPTPEEYRGRFPAAWSLDRPRTRRSWAFLPLIVAGRTIGAWMAGFAYPVSFSPDERSVLTTIARMLAQALSRAALQETERELSDGLQRSMLPAGKPDIPGLAVAARYVPTGGGLQVGGDWYDVIGLPSGRTALVIGDVQGHDVRAAGIMGQLRIAVRAYASEGHHPDAVLSRASRFLAGLTEPEGPDGRYAPRFATCLYMEVDPVAGTLDIARAGHPDPAVRLADGTMMIRPTEGGLPLGIDPDTDYPTTRVVLEPGETLLMCTDGLIETGGHDLETGWERIRAAFERAAAGSEGPDDLEALAEALVQAVHGPPSHHTTGPLADRREDDIALLLIRREAEVCLVGAGSAPVRRTAVTVAQAEPERIAGARRQLRDMLHDWADPDQVESAVLMLSEMVTNVLVHTDGDALLVAEVSGRRGSRRLRLDVADSSDELPHRRRPGELASSGRGLLLMEMLADSWGVDPRGDGKCIWYELYETSPDQRPGPDAADGAARHA
ncbi:magnesium or manganese-dependent protein phosphatase [Streptomyces hygroscopicus subsp. sporocinereus]|uniref:Magnesium or manganese-dependent protein phosphatase n=1 Tax=Streptomyces hygroscopicus TaxID=1912 RepID=A0ABQ3U3W6_STRHY|nr:SpoIIE family protein phosphatase [Streptomyces hygroscopicus]GHJ30076.1 magnesium or manganese-dependent protein phosphatase [Streptomyces hygroscopicus]